MIEVECPNCSYENVHRDDSEGRYRRCVNCGYRYIVEFRRQEKAEIISGEEALKITKNLNKGIFGCLLCMCMPCFACGFLAILINGSTNIVEKPINVENKYQVINVEKPDEEEAIFLKGVLLVVKTPVGNFAKVSHSKKHREDGRWYPLMNGTVVKMVSYNKEYSKVEICTGEYTGNICEIASDSFKKK